MKTTFILPFSRNILLILSGLYLTSCHVAYIPSMENVPLMQKKGELQANLTPANFQAAFSPVQNLAVMMNGQVSGNKWTESGDLEYEAKRQFVEGAIGYYTKMEEDRIFEIYGGAGVGSLRLHDDWAYDNRKYEAGMMRTFVQPSIGLTNDYIDFAFSARFLQLKFIHPEITNYTPDDLVSLKLKDLDTNPYYFIEPAITFRAGYKFIKAHMQYLYSFKLNQEDINRYNQYLFFGISLRF